MSRVTITGRDAWRDASPSQRIRMVEAMPLSTRRTRSAYAPRTKVGTALSRATWADWGALGCFAIVAIILIGV